MTQTPRRIHAAQRHFTPRRASAGLPNKPLGNEGPISRRSMAVQTPFSGSRLATRYHGDIKIFESPAITAQYGP